MSSPLRERPDGLVIALSATVGLITAMSFVATSDWPWIAVALLALTVELAQFARHDRRHRARAERPHAMWGLDDKNRPKWLRR